MHRNRTKMGAVLVMAVVATALMPARVTAFDLTGRWEGKLSCHGIVGGQKRTLKRSSSTLLIYDAEQLQISADGIFYNGKDIPSIERPERGEVVAIRCGSSATVSGGEFGGEFARLKVSTKPAKGSGSLRGTSLRTDTVLAQSVYSCRWSYKRVSTALPSLEGCP